MSAERLPREFFTRPTLEVAPEMLGKYLVAQSPEGRVAGEVTEVEAYLGEQDPASHAYHGKTPRTTAMWLAGGHWYVYFIYGKHLCLNVVTELEGVAGAVLLRAVRPVEGITLMQQRRMIDADHIPRNLTNGPAKLAQAFGVARTHYGTDSTTSSQLWLEDRGVVVPQVFTSPRIGISKAIEAEWRFTSMS